MTGRAWSAILIEIFDLNSARQCFLTLCGIALLLQVLPGCLLLHFAAADLQEGQGDIEAARQVYQELLPSLSPDEPLATPPPQVPCPCSPYSAC